MKMLVQHGCGLVSAMLRDALTPEDAGKIAFR
jgi:hypothetical protein